MNEVMDDEVDGPWGKDTEGGSEGAPVTGRKQQMIKLLLLPQKLV